MNTPTRRDVQGWALFDFGSSAFNTLIVTFIFSRYFTDVIAGGSDDGAIAWTRAVNLSAVIVAVLMPVLGAIADYSGRKKAFLVGFSLLSIAFTIPLFWTGPGDVLPALALFVVANVGFEASNVFYNAFLPEVSTPATMGRVSGLGFALGYVGGLLCLAVGLAMFYTVSAADSLNVRVTIPLVAAWYLVFSLPMFLGVRERTVRRSAPLGEYVRQGFGRLFATVHHLRDLREAAKLMVARMIYNDGLVTVIAMASIYTSAELKMRTDEMLRMAIALNVAAGIGAWAFGYIDDRIGGKRTLVISLVGLTAASALGVATDSSAWFWVAATLIGVLMGPNQAASRSLLAKLVPEHKHAELFGLYAFSGKMSSLLGPLAYGTALELTGSHRIAMASIVAFFIVGLVLLGGVREREGIALADKLNEEFASVANAPRG